jgi:uncharacterized protein HemX
MKLRSFALTAALVLTTSAAAFAQSGSTIYQRKDNQQDRISQGVRNGQLTPRETTHLERQESRINREEHYMRSQNHGRLTRQDRRILSRQQNRESHRIYRDKHNYRHSRY